MVRLSGRIAAWFLGGLIVLLLDAGICFWSIQRTINDAHAQTYTHRTIDEVAGVLSSLKDAETGERGFFITGRKRFLAPYQIAMDQLKRRVPRLAERLKSPVQQRRLRRLTALIKPTIAQWNAMIALRETRHAVGPATTLAAMNRAKIAMDRMRLLLGDIKRFEQHSLAAKLRDSDRSGSRALLSLIISGLLNAALLAALFRVVRSDAISRAAAAESLRESELRLRAILDNSPPVIYLKDAGGRYLLVNRAFERAFGLKREDIEGKTDFDIFPAATAREFKENDQHVLTTGQSIEYEETAPHADGPHTYISMKFPLPYPGIGMVLCGISTDITDRKQRESEMAQARNRFQLALKKAPVVLFTQDADLRYTWTHNSAGMTDSRALGKTDADLLGREDAAAFTEMKTDVLKTGRGRRGELAATVDGQRHYYDVTVEPIIEDAAVRGLACAAIDITDRVVARREAEAASQAKDHFLASLSHELRTPLTPVLLTVAAMEQQPNVPPNLRGDLAIIRDSVQLEARLIDDLLDLTRISRGKLELRLRPTDLHAVLEQVIRTSQSGQPPGQRPSMAYRPQAAQCWVSADPPRLQQIFWNLLRNAMKFTPATGSIEVSTHNHDGKVVVEIADTGMGIDPDDLPNIFNAFEQTNRDVTRQFGGLGLGLAITRALVEQHGGAIRAQSAGKGLGATFTVQLACVESPQAPAESADNSGAQGQETPALRILLIEDHQQSATVMRRLLGTFGHTVRHAGTLADARIAAEHEPFDLVISDLGLPDGSGTDLMPDLARQYGLPGIALSGYGMAEDVEKSLASGFAEHLVKPIDLDVLRAAIARVHANSKSRKAVAKP